MRHRRNRTPTEANPKHEGKACNRTDFGVGSWQFGILHNIRWRNIRQHSGIHLRHAFVDFHVFCRVQIYVENHGQRHRRTVCCRALHHNVRLGTWHAPQQYDYRSDNSAYPRSAVHQWYPRPCQRRLHSRCHATTRRTAGVLLHFAWRGNRIYD